MGARSSYGNPKAFSAEKDIVWRPGAWGPSLAVNKGRLPDMSAIGFLSGLRAGGTPGAASWMSEDR